MTDYKMTEERRKKLTEFLGSNMLYTYDDDVSMLAVFRKIRDVGKWVEFIGFVAKQMTLGSMHAEHFMIWLFLDNPERACCLAADFLEEQGT